MQTETKFEAGRKVRLKADPGRIGTITGRSRTAGGSLLYEIEFGPNDRPYQRSSQLEILPEHETMNDLFAAGRFGGPEDLSRLVITAKLAGDLTNVFYSMGIGNTDFFPHQFKPVLKFIESQRGRLLIADEVGLGKTIESVYIWKELQAREGSRRLLVVCPSMLREKWQRDFEVRFGMEAVIVGAKELSEMAQGAVRNPSTKSFALITSLEGIRTRMTDWDSDSSLARARLCGLLEESADRATEPIFDLVIIDEAHYLRNANTAGHQTAALLRDNAGSLVLLSATPIQTSEENLFNLLRLLSPEEYTSLNTFQDLSKSNSALIELENEIRYRSDILTVRTILSRIASLGTPLDKELIDELERRLEKGSLFPEERIDLARRIGERSFFYQYVSRTRKRDVLENRVIRVAMTYKFSFGEYERSLYDTVTKHLRSQPRSGSTLSLFALIARQRQMTSCLPAAFKHWQDNDSMNEALWDDLGFGGDEDDPDLSDVKVPGASLPVDVEMNRLEQNDSKYAELKKRLSELLSAEPGQKVIIFTYYRGTITYLRRRLAHDGFNAESIMGGMGDEKYRIIEEFSQPQGPNILVSSEVGAEGIDLQFCHVIINYDLPWNPMKLEQRIGRIDRIGQASDRIFIYNMSCVDTVEDSVLSRLYERIQIFTSSIGDLEDIMGDIVERLALDLIDPNLTDREREERMEQNIMSVVQRRELRGELEDKAIELFGFGDYIIRSINDAQTMDRYIGPRDTLALVEAFFSNRFPGTRIMPHKITDARSIRLSPEAKVGLITFLERERSPIPTQLSRSESDILCLFEPKSKPGRTNVAYERIDAIHPLVKWIVEENGKRMEDSHPCSAIELAIPPEGLVPGVYAYAVQVWSAEGWKAKKELRFFAARIGEPPLTDTEAERLVVSSLRSGTRWLDMDGRTLAGQSADTMDAIVEYGFTSYAAFEAEFLAENDRICEKQYDYATRTAERKLSDVRSLIERLEAEGKTRVIPMHRSRIAKVETQLEIQKQKIDRFRKATTNNRELAIGIIKSGVF